MDSGPVFSSSNSTITELEARLTLTFRTPSTEDKVLSTLEAQDAHVMPVTGYVCLTMAMLIERFCCITGFCQKAYDFLYGYILAFDGKDLPGIFKIHLPLFDPSLAIQKRSHSPQTVLAVDVGYEFH